LGDVQAIQIAAIKIVNYLERLFTKLSWRGLSFQNGCEGLHISNHRQQGGEPFVGSFTLSLFYILETLGIEFVELFAIKMLIYSIFIFIIFIIIEYNNK